MEQLLSLDIINSDDIDEQVKQAGWLFSPQHWWAKAYHPDVHYRIYQKNNRGKLEAIILSESSPRTFHLQYYSSAENSRTVNDYNKCIQKLHKELESYGLSATIENGINIPEISNVSIHTLKALSRFSNSADHSSSSMHPLETQKWLEFIIASIYMQDAPMLKNLLVDALTIKLKWDDKIAEELRKNYLEIVSIINFYTHVEGARKSWEMQAHKLSQHELS